MVGLFVRVLNYKIWVFPIVVLSFFGLRCNVTRMFWDVLTSMRILYSYKTILVIATKLGAIGGQLHCNCNRGSVITVYYHVLQLRP